MTNTVIPSAHIAAFAAALFCTLVLPAALLIGLGIAKKIRLAPLALGFASFFVSQMVLRIPLLQALSLTGWFQGFAASHIGLYTLLVGGLSAGLFEESGRLAGALVLKHDRTYKDMLSFGLGHGLCEVMALAGVGHINNLLVSLALNDPAGPFGLLVAGLDGAVLEAAAAQLAAATPGLVALGLLERVSAVLFHLFATCLVFTGVRRRQAGWYFAAAVGAHTLSNTAATWLAFAGVGLLGIELLLLAAGLAMGGYVLRARRAWGG